MLRIRPEPLAVFQYTRTTFAGSLREPWEFLDLIELCRGVFNTRSTLRTCPKWSFSGFRALRLQGRMEVGGGDGQDRRQSQDSGSKQWIPAVQRIIEQD